MERLVILGLIGLIAICLGLAGIAWALADRQERRAEVPAPRTGMELLQAYRCHRSEIKRIIVRGVEDGFSPQGDEPIFIHPRLRTARFESLMAGGAYDQSQPDRAFIDTIELPPNISRGLFVISLRALTENSNDTIVIGDLATLLLGSQGQRMLQMPVVGLPALEGWRVSGPLHHAEFAEIRFETSRVATPAATPATEPSGGPYRTLLDYVRGAEGPRLVDVRVQDDTSVDFVGVAICEEPLGEMGLTYGLDSLSMGPEGIVSLSCDSRPRSQRICNPYVGDTPCGTALPVACFRDADVPVPAAAVESGIGNYWSGGRIAIAPPAPANRFATIAEANAYCASELGAGWRVATYHDGGRGSRLTGFGDLGDLSTSVWVDIRGQPYATCWAH